MVYTQKTRVAQPLLISKAKPSKQFLNLRAKMHWEGMKAVLDKRVGYPEDEELRRQIINVTYEVKGSNGEIKITDKSTIKRSLGCSPDRSDCWFMGIYISDIAEPYVPRSKDAWEIETSDDYEFSSATC